MAEQTYSGAELTRHIATVRLYFGRSAVHWWRFYGLIAVLWFLLVATYTRYLELFDDIESQSAGYQEFVMWFSGSALLIMVPAAAAFIWWAAGALVRYSKWQLRHRALWRWFWVVVLVFYGYVEFDPLDAIHPVMSFKGLGEAPDFVAMFATGYKLSEGIPLMKFQWGYFLLWWLLIFLVVAVHWQYVLDGVREVWFYTRRFHRYGASVLTGFRQTWRTSRQPPVTLDYPRERAQLPPDYRGVPELNVARLTAAQAAAIVAADASGAIVAAPGQDSVLFIDLGRYDYSPQLAELRAEDGTALLSFSDTWAPPSTSREDLVLPLRAAADGVGASERTSAAGWLSPAPTDSAASAGGEA